jgi:uncharacterized repeat protein (TIGR01451 family)
MIASLGVSFVFIIALVGAAPSEAASGIAISKTADQEAVLAGDAIGFTVTVTNPGSGTIRDVNVSDPLPSDSGTSWSIDSQSGAACSILSGSMSCWMASLAAGGRYSVHLASPTTAATADASPVDNTASVTGSRTGSKGSSVFYSASASASIQVRVATSIVAAPTVATPIVGCGLPPFGELCWNAHYTATVVAENGEVINEGTVTFEPGLDDNDQCVVPVWEGLATCTVGPIWSPPPVPTATYSGSARYAPSSNST